MKKPNRQIWPFQPKTSIASSVVLLVGLLLGFVVLRITTGWPGEDSESTVLIGIILLSLLPVLLSLIEVFIERGGTIEYRGIKINFAQLPRAGSSGLRVPVNIGVRGEAVSDSSTTQILDALKQATSSEVVVIDLEEGQAWWETRLLVLLAGAVRLKKPDKVVFVGKEGNIEHYFQGWGYATDLLPNLLSAHSQYARSYYAARAAALQWKLVEPVNPADSDNPSLLPPQPSQINTGLAAQYPWMAFEGAKGLPNPFLAEQILASDLGDKIEYNQEPKRITLVRLEELFRPVLHTGHLDEHWPPDRQLDTFFKIDADYIAATQNGKYKTLVSRLSVLNGIIEDLIGKKYL